MPQLSGNEPILGLNISLIFPLFLLAQRKRKRHIEKQREGKSVRLSTR
jgi:hypothetical protein